MLVGHISVILLIEKSGVMLIKIKNKIEIYNAPLSVKKTIKKTVTLNNPMYWKMARMGNTKALYACPKNFKYYSEIDGCLSIGRGMQDRLIKYLDKWKYKYEIKDETTRAKCKCPNVDRNFRLRPYQYGDVEHIAVNKFGVIRLGTGYGKSILASLLYARHGVKSLFIVPRDHLLKQFVQTIKNLYKTEPGIIQGKICRIQNVTIASIQTLVSQPKIAVELQNKFGMVIVDEGHTFITKKRLDIIQTFNPEYLYCLTATPRRTDEQSKAIFFTYGPIIIDKDLERAKPEIKLVRTDVKIPVLENYAEMIDLQVSSPQRNSLIIDVIWKELEKKRRILVLTKRIAHYRALSGEFGAYKVYSIESNQKSHDRANLLQDLREGKQKFDIIFGTYSMLSTGTDIPALDTLIFAGDLRSDVLQEQSAGRILRLFGDKQHPKIIDIVDNRNGILFNQARARIKFYKKQGWV